MKLKSIKSAKQLSGKRVLLRVAYDVPLRQKGGRWVVSDDRRINETIPTIEYLIKRRCRIVLMSWLGRPGGKVVNQLSMEPVAKPPSARLSYVMSRPSPFAVLQMR